MKQLLARIQFSLQTAILHLHHHQAVSHSCFLLGTCILLLRHIIASAFSNNLYALVFYEIDIIVIGLFALGIKPHTAKWCKCAIDFLLIFFALDFIERFFYESSNFNFIDLIGLVVAVLVVIARYKSPKT